MTTEEVINILSKFNTWRRGLPPYEWNEDPSKQVELPYSAKEIGVAIDEAVDMLRQSAGMVERANNLIEANAKTLEYRHKDADAVLAAGNYILKGVRP